MGRIAVEIIPHDEAGLRADIEVIKKYPQVDCVNIPDLMSFELRPWQAAEFTQPALPTIPHVRAMDIDLKKPLPMRDDFIKFGVKEVLIIAGDPPKDLTRTVYPTETIDVIRKFREELPEVKVYAGVDQYRSGIREELYRVERKAQAGASGFFTQPFFDMRFLEMYADLLDGHEVYWGVSPVLSSRSRGYWERKDKAVFPKNFLPTMDWNIDFAKRVIEFVKSSSGGLYFMPITIDIADLLPKVFD